MVKNNIQYPYAFNQNEEKLVHITELCEVNKEYIPTNLICKDCHEPFIAVINHSTPHFKHNSTSNCSGTKETYIHWITKEFFRSINKIYLPEITIDDLPESERQKFQFHYNKIIDKNIPEELRYEFKKNLKRNLTEKLVLQVDEVQIEKQFNSPIGNIVVDVVLINSKKQLFIEPFYSSPIYHEKREKIKLIDINTFTIDLKKYLEKNLLIFSKRSLKDYLIKVENKKLDYLNKAEFENILLDYKNYLKVEITRFKPFIELSNEFNKRIIENQNRKKELLKKIEILKQKITDIEDENYELQNEKDNMFENYELT